jgi:hypothetical protein
MVTEQIEMNPAECGEWSNVEVHRPRLSRSLRTRVLKIEVAE